MNRWGRPDAYGAGNDIIVALGSGSELSGGAGDDLLIAGGLGAVDFANADTMLNSSMYDMLNPEEGAMLDGGAGNDILVGGFGDDTLNGGEGADTYVYSLGEGQDTIIGDMQDTLVIQGGVMGDLSGLNVVTSISDMTEDTDVLAFMRKTDDGTAAFLELYNMGEVDTHHVSIGTITFDLANGDMIDTLKIGDLEVDMSVMLEGASTVSGTYEANWGNTLQYDHDTLGYDQEGGERLDEVSTLDKMEAVLEEALEGGGGVEMYTQEGIQGVATETVETLLGTEINDDML